MLGAKDGHAPKISNKTGDWDLAFGLPKIGNLPNNYTKRATEHRSSMQKMGALRLNTSHLTTSVTICPNRKGDRKGMRCAAHIQANSAYLDGVHGRAPRSRVI